MIKIKVAVISDIHGNIVALNQILKDCKENNVDEYVFTGDLMNDLPFGNEVLDIVKDLTKYVVRGNKEEYLIEYDKKHFKWDNLQFKNAIFMYNNLKKENLEYVKNLPLKLSLKFEDVSLLLCHGSPIAVEDKIHEEDNDKMIKFTKTLKEDILLFGHTHQSIWYKKVNGKWFINAGCAGVSPYNVSKAEYVILDIKANDLKIEKRLVDFDVKLLKDLIIKSGILNGDKVLMSLTYGAITGKGQIRENFFKEGKELMLEKNKKLYKDDATGIFKYFKLYDDDIWMGLYSKYKNELKFFEE